MYSFFPLYSQNGGGQLDVSNTRFEYNNASVSGGAVYLSFNGGGATGHFADSIFSYNKAKVSLTSSSSSSLSSMILYIFEILHVLHKMVYNYKRISIKHQTKLNKTKASR